MHWCIKNVEAAYKPISHGPPQRRIETDSSTTGYGGHDVTNDLEISGMWDDDEKELHINYLRVKSSMSMSRHFVLAIEINIFSFL